MMPGVGWITVLTVLPGLLAFALSRRFSARAGWIVVACVALLNVPTIVGALVVLAAESQPHPGASAYIVPAGAEMGANSYLLLGSLLFVGATVLSAVLGTIFGARRTKEAEA